MTARHPLRAALAAHRTNAVRHPLAQVVRRGLRWLIEAAAIVAFFVTCAGLVTFASAAGWL